MSGSEQHHDDRSSDARTPGARLPLRPGTVTSLGSLPHRDADEAAAFVLERHPGLPAAPQLPRRSPLEGMVAQSARGIEGVTVGSDGTVRVDGAGLDPSAPVRTPIDGTSHGGLLAFLSAAAGRTEPVKIQLTGPITLALALVDAGADPDVAFPVAGAAVSVQAKTLVSLVRRRLPDAPLLAVLDEPGLVALPADRIPLSADGTIDLLSGSLAALEAVGVTTGVHCCGSTDWRLVSQAGPTVIALPADEMVLSDAGALAAHLERGGWVAWGAVPTDQPVGADVDRLWRQLTALWCELVRLGCDPGLLRTQAVVTPACGLAGHGISQAGLWLELAAQLAGRVSDQAVAARLSMGA
ncbi:MAG: hypothetical protein WD232_02545 [Acidimicrobiales bacterium]